MKKSGQSILEYILIIAVAAAAVSAMAVYVQRSTQANLKLIEEQIEPEPVTNSVGNFSTY